jgi:hypothetical protein
MMDKLKGALVALGLLSGSAALSACDDEGPMERAGETADETVEKAGDAVEDATDQ